MILRLSLFASLLLLGGCVTFTAVGPGEIEYTGFKIRTDSAWNQAPRELSGRLRADSWSLTKNGYLLDRLLIIPAVPDGEPIFRQFSEAQALPKFEATMLPNEIEELTESSVVKLFGEGGAAVETSGLRPHRFGNDRGILFDLGVQVSDGPDYKGVVGAVVAGGKLYLVLFLGAEPYYYEKQLDEVLEIIKSARVDTPVAQDESGQPLAPTGPAAEISRASPVG